MKENDEDAYWLNLDMHANPGVHIVHNLEDLPLPLPDNSVDFILASHVLEHLRNWKELMPELHRILKPRGCLHIKVPEGRCRAAIADPTHCNFFVPESWLHWDREIDLGFETLKTSSIGFELKWNEAITHHRVGIDDGVPGNYFTELLVDFEKVGDIYQWEVVANKAIKEREQCQKP
jgi:SAM-dependent methyltransferase